MQKKYVVAFDQGTTSTRTIVFDLKGQIKSTAQKELTQHYPQSGWVEHDPKKIYTDQLETFNKAIESAEIHPEEIAAIGITNQRESLVIWDGLSGEPLHPIILWLDTRTIDTVSTLEKKLGSKDALRSITGLPISTYFTGVKLKWIMDNVPNVKDAIINGRAKVGMH